MSKSFNLHARFSGHQGSIYSIIYADSPNTFYSAGGDKMVVQWNLNNPEEGVLIAKADDVIYSLCLIKISSILLIGQAQGGVHIVDLKTKKEMRLLKLHSAPVFSIIIDPSNNYIFTLGGDGVLHILDIENFKLIKSLKISTGKLRSVIFNEQKNIAYVGCGEGAIQEIYLNDFSLGHRWMAHQEGFSVNCLYLLKNNSLLLTGSRDAHLNGFDVNDYQKLISIPAHNYAIYDIALNVNNTFLATASRDKTVKIWNPETLEIIQRLEKQEADGHINSVNKLLWMDENTLLSTGDDRSIACWKYSGIQ